MNFIVVGCGRVGSELANRLSQKGHKVTVIDSQVEAFGNLPDDFRGRTVEGEVLNDGVLIRAGIEEADGIAAVTTSDSINLVVSHIARSRFHIPNVIARNYNPDWRELFEVFDIQVVSSSSWGAQRIEELLYHQEMRTVFSAGNGEVELYEFTIPPSCVGSTFEELIPSQSCRPMALTRAGKASLPEPDMALIEGDVLLVSATFDGITALRRRLVQEEKV